MISVKGTAKVVTLARTDPVFARLRAEAEDAVRKEPDIAGFIFSAILNQESLETAIVHRLAARTRASGVSGRSHRAGLFRRHCGRSFDP